VIGEGKEPHGIIEGLFLVRHFDLRDIQSSLGICSIGRDGHPLAVHAVDPVLLHLGEGVLRFS
jgi:hypothetical protein